MSETGKPPAVVQPAWLRLYLARRARQPTLLPIHQPAGRPRRRVPMKQTTLWLTAGDRDLVARWQGYLKDLAGGSISLGETIAILARICDDRFNTLGGERQFKDLTDFTLQMIHGQTQEERAELGKKPVDN